MKKINTYLLETAVKIVMIEREYTTMEEFHIRVMIAYRKLERYGNYKMKNGMTYHRDGTATRE